MLSVRLDSKNHHIVASGSVISFNEDPLTITLPLEGEDLVFLMTFGRDAANPDKPSVKVLPHGDRKLELQLVNFNYDLGTGNNTPLELGVMNGKPLFLSYRVYSLADSDCRLIHYTFYREK